MPPDVSPIDPDAILRQPFTSVKRGYDPLEVQTFLMALAGELRAARDRSRELERAVAEAERQLAELREPSPSRLTALVGEETARVLEAANAAAADIRTKAEQAAAQELEDVRAEAARIREEARAAAEAERAEAERVAAEIRQQVEGLLEQARSDAEREVEAGRQQGREMVAEAQQVRERMLRDLARRRKALRQQIEQLQAGRERLLAAYEVVRRHLDEVTEELTVALPEARQAAEALAGRDRVVEDDDTLERELGELAVEAGIELGTVEEPEAPAGDELRAEASTPDAPGPRAPDPVEGRKSSAVNVIRTGGGEPDELLEDGEEPEEAGQPEKAVGPGDAMEPVEPGEGAAAGSGARVAGLFARIKEEAAQLDAAGSAIDPDRPDAGGDAEAVATGESVDPAEQQEAATATIERDLARRLKRELSEEQNELLDALRRERGVPALDAVLPAPEAHVERFASATLAGLAAARGAGSGAGLGRDAGAPGAGSGRVDELAAELAAELVGPLRDRLQRCFTEAGDDPDDLAERVRSCYRECRTQAIDELVSAAVRSASGAGPVEPLGEGSGAR
ncbi:DivIVA domain-containing protein [Rhabdothermincola sediminis]|uniref:DivIVA domain-containing protein n=1 Tax=Rhabdothermincola sediminis TaxID=2751370 RepID=UPI001AA06B91|nr:DivIVA domain-containing protein [Rhabdothermincola sediminis]